MVRRILLSLAVLAASVVVNATSPIMRSGSVNMMSGCLDCFNFVAPTISGAESVNPAEVGLIVYDSYFGIFRGYNSAGVWSKLSVEKPVRSLTSTTTLLVQDEFVKVDASMGTVTLSLPAAASMTGRELIIKKTDSSANAVTLDPNSTETIDGALTRAVSVQNELVRITSDGANWQTSSQQNRAPTIQKFTSSSGTYYTPVGVSHIRVRMVGGGGGGAGSGIVSSSSSGQPGTASTFGSSFLTAGNGSGAAWGGAGGAGGTPTVGGGVFGLALAGGGGGSGGIATSASSAVSGYGGANSLVGGGASVVGGTTGSSGLSNTGGGGAGGGAAYGTVNQQAGGGGGAGAYIDVLISNPSLTYSYGVGSGGSGGSAGTGAGAASGGAGGSGVIIVEEYYK